MNQQDQFDRILLSLYEAALGDMHWQGTSALIDDACELVGSHLCILDKGTMLFDQMYSRGEPRPDFREDYLKNYFAHDERVPRVLQLPDSLVVRAHDVYTDAERRTSPTYNELLVRNGAQDGLQIRLDGPDGLDIVWVTGDPAGSDGWSSGQLRMIERLLPHVRQFVRVRQALSGAGALNSSLTALLDNAMIGVVYLDGRGVIVEANTRARDILRRGDGLEDRAGYLRALVAADDLRLGRLLARVLPGSGSAATSGSIAVQRSPTLPRMAVHVLPVAVEGREFVISRVAALVLMVDPGAKPRVDVERVGASLGLTRAESRVAVALAEGASVRDIATTTGRQESSVRWLIKQIHAKLEIPRNADLVRMVLSAAWGTGPPPSEPQRGVVSGSPAKRRSLITPLSERRGLAP